MCNLIKREMSPGSCVPKIHPSFKTWFDLQKRTIAHRTFINFSLTRSCILHLLINRSPENGSVVDVWVEDEVGSGVAKRKVVFHKLPLARVVSSLVEMNHGGKQFHLDCQDQGQVFATRMHLQTRQPPGVTDDSGGVHQRAAKIQVLRLLSLRKVHSVPCAVNAHTVSIVRVAGFVFSSAFRRPFFAPVSGA